MKTKKKKDPADKPSSVGRGGKREGSGRKRELPDELKNKAKVYIGAPNVRKWNAIKRAYCDDGDIFFTKKLLEFAEKHVELLASYLTGKEQQEERCVTPDEHCHEDDPNGPPQYFICLRVTFDLHRWFCKLHTHSQLEPSSFIVHLLLLYMRWHDVDKEFRPETFTKLLEELQGQLPRWDSSKDTSSFKPPADCSAQSCLMTEVVASCDDISLFQQKGQGEIPHSNDIVARQNVSNCPSDVQDLGPERPSVLSQLQSPFQGHVTYNQEQSLGHSHHMRTEVQGHHMQGEGQGHHKQTEVQGRHIHTEGEGHHTRIQTDGQGRPMQIVGQGRRIQTEGNEKHGHFVARGQMLQDGINQNEGQVQGNENQVIMIPGDHFWSPAMAIRGPEHAVHFGKNFNSANNSLPVRNFNVRNAHEEEMNRDVIMPLHQPNPRHEAEQPSSLGGHLQTDVPQAQDLSCHHAVRSTSSGEVMPSSESHPIPSNHSQIRSSSPFLVHSRHQNEKSVCQPGDGFIARSNEGNPREGLVSDDLRTGSRQQQSETVVIHYLPEPTTDTSSGVIDPLRVNPSAPISVIQPNHQLLPGHIILDITDGTRIVNVVNVCDQSALPISTNHTFHLPVGGTEISDGRDFHQIGNSTALPASAHNNHHIVTQQTFLPPQILGQPRTETQLVFTTQNEKGPVARSDSYDHQLQGCLDYSQHSVGNTAINEHYSVSRQHIPTVIPHWEPMQTFHSQLQTAPHVADSSVAPKVQQTPSSVSGKDASLLMSSALPVNTSFNKEQPLHGKNRAIGYDTEGVSQPQLPGLPSSGQSNVVYGEQLKSTPGQLLGNSSVPSVVSGSGSGRADNFVTSIHVGAQKQFADYPEGSIQVHRSTTAYGHHKKLEISRSGSRVNPDLTSQVLVAPISIAGNVHTNQNPASVWKSVNEVRGKGSVSSGLEILASSALGQCRSTKQHWPLPGATTDYGRTSTIVRSSSENDFHHDAERVLPSQNQILVAGTPVRDSQTSICHKVEQLVSQAVSSVPQSLVSMNSQPNSTPKSLPSSSSSGGGTESVIGTTFLQESIPQGVNMPISKSSVAAISGNSSPGNMHEKSSMPVVSGTNHLAPLLPAKDNQQLNDHVPANSSKGSSESKLFQPPTACVKLKELLLRRTKASLTSISVQDSVANEVDEQMSEKEKEGGSAHSIDDENCGAPDPASHTDPELSDSADDIAVKSVKRKSVRTSKIAKRKRSAKSSRTLAAKSAHKKGLVEAALGSKRTRRKSNTGFTGETFAEMPKFHPTRTSRRRTGKDQNRCLFPDFSSEKQTIAKTDMERVDDYLVRENVNDKGKKLKMYECKFCHTLRRSVGNMKRHLVTHGKVFKCNRCNATFSTKNGLYFHKQKESGKKFDCNQCSFSTYYVPFLRAHMKRSHPVKPEKIICDICGKSLKNKTSLKSHLETHKSDHIKEVCGECGKLFSSVKYLRRHEKRVHSTKDHKCTYSRCDKSFPSKSQLKMHVDRVHLRIHRFSCTYPNCDQAFFKMAELQQHIRVHHTNERTFLCKENGCGKAFRSRHNLVVHMRLHTNDKPFKCQKCTYCCRQRNALNFHMRRHHSGNESKEMEEGERSNDRDKNSHQQVEYIESSTPVESNLEIISGSQAVGLTDESGVPQMFVNNSSDSCYSVLNPVSVNSTQNLYIPISDQMVSAEHVATSMPILTHHTSTGVTLTTLTPLLGSGGVTTISSQQFTNFPQEIDTGSTAVTQVCVEHAAVEY